MTVQSCPRNERPPRTVLEPKGAPAAGGTASDRWGRVESAWCIGALVIALALIVPASTDLGICSFVIDRPGSPINIVSYESGLARGSRISLRGAPPAAIQHQLRYANARRSRWITRASSRS